MQNYARSIRGSPPGRRYILEGGLIVLCAAFLAVGCGSSGRTSTRNPEASRGVLDLSAYRAEAAARGPVGAQGRSAAPGGIVALDGEWAFWWDRFLDPAALASGQAVPAPVYGVFPGEWANYGIPGATAQGHGTYRLLVSGLDPDVRYALRLSSFQTSARVYANGRIVHLQGVPGTSREMEVPAWASDVVPVESDAAGKLEIIAHVSNYADRAGGSRTSILLGPHGAVETARERQRMVEVFLFGGILVMGFYYLALYTFRPKDRASLWFGLLCLILSFRILLYDEYIILELLPSLSWSALFRMGFLTFSLAVPLLSAFLSSLYPKLFWKPVRWIILGGSAAYSVLIAAAPTLLISNLLTFFQVFALASGAVLFAVLIRALVGKEPGAAWLTGGFGCLFAAVIHDVLASQGLLNGPFTVQFGLLFFLFAMSLVVTRKLSVSFQTAERLSENLRRMNISLERFVPREFLQYLKKSSIDEIALGDHTAQRMTVLFSDIRSFTRISEKLKPEDTFQFINSYLERIGPAVRSHGGFVDKYLGDGIMALFPEDGDAAVQCAIEMQRRIAQFNAERTGLDPICAGIGIHSGPLMLGTIGENERMDGTVISDVVNMSARLEGLTKEYELGIAVSEQILASVKDSSVYRIRSLGKIGVKGKREPMAVFEIYDGDSDDLVLRKDAIRDSFEEAIRAFYGQDYAKAMRGFRDTLEILPRDEPSHHYIRMIRKMQLA